MLKTRIYHSLFCSVFLVAVLCTACGYKANPKVPFRNIPERIMDIRTEYMGQKVYLSFVIPDRTERKQKLTRLGGVRIYRKHDLLFADMAKLEGETQQEQKQEAEESKAGAALSKGSKSRSQQTTTTSQTRTAFGFGREMTTPGGNVESAQTNRDFQPLDFKDNYSLLADLPLDSDQIGKSFTYVDELADSADAPLNEPQKYDYVVVTYLEDGKPSRFSKIYYVIAYPAPKTPQNLACTQDGETVTLTWDTVTEMTDGSPVGQQVYYLVYRTLADPAADGQEADPFPRPISAKPITDGTFTDKDAKNNQTYRYYVRAAVKGKKGLVESADSPDCRIEVRDTQAPSSVVGLVHVLEKEGVYLIWKPNLEADVLGYNIYRKKRGKEEYEQINGAPVKASRYLDPLPPKGIYYYYVTTLDTSEPANESHPSRTIEVIIR